MKGSPFHRAVVALLRWLGMRRVRRSRLALIDGGPRSATVTAATDLVCYGLTFWEFRPLVERNGTIAWKLLQALAKRLRAASGDGKAT